LALADRNKKIVCLKLLMNMPKLGERSTMDLVVLAFSALICSSVLFIVVGIIIQKTLHPDMDLSKAGEAVYSMLNTIIGALIGFISGRFYGRHEGKVANGELTK
jgi:hypothetical protein